MSFVLPVDDELVLRLVEPRHAKEIFAQIDANRKHLRAWMPWIEATRRVADTRTWAENACRAFGAQTDVPLSIVERGRVVGGIGLHGLQSPHNGAETGYWIAADCQGRGLVTRSMRCLLDHAFNDRKLHRVYLHTAEQNTRSRNVAERVGFRQEGVLQDAFWKDDRYQTMVLYAMLAREWAASVAVAQDEDEQSYLTNVHMS